MFTTQLDTRWLTEDLPYGLAMWTALAEPVGVEMPIARSLITLGSALLGRNFTAGDRDLRALGIDALLPASLQHYLQTGVKS